MFVNHAKKTMYSKIVLIPVLVGFGKITRLIAHQFMSKITSPTYKFIHSRWSRIFHKFYGFHCTLPWSLVTVLLLLFRNQFAGFQIWKPTRQTKFAPGEKSEKQERWRWKMPPIKWKASGKVLDMDLRSNSRSYTVARVPVMRISGLSLKIRIKKIRSESISLMGRHVKMTCLLVAFHTSHVNSIIASSWVNGMFWAAFSGCFPDWLRDERVLSFLFISATSRTKKHVMNSN